ncbi:DNA-binding transcriptional activator XapR [Escherichia coli]|uniref:DNA-binding transcriptional activator XapR n=1 Tax=Escherichia coli TaxID=562 RepID=A0A2X1Q4K4_ECOLX|nr:DNA-binding transcriptional activator XapR [Escherichia coli]
MPGSGEWRQNHRLVLPAYGCMNRRFWWRCLKRHHLSSFSTVPLEALRDEYFVTMPPVYTDWDFCSELPAGGFSPVVIREVNEPQTVLAMVSMGIGITLIADSYAQMNWPGVIFRPLKQRIPADLYIVYETQQVTPAMVKLLAALTQ